MKEDQNKKASLKSSRIGFRIHLLVFVLVNAYLVGINLFTGGYFWAGWVISSWGLGLSIQGLVYYLMAHTTWLDEE